MATFTRWMAQACYALFGTSFLVAGGIVLLYNTRILPETWKDALLGFSRSNLDILHLLQELAALLVLVALITFWFVRYYEQSQPFHWAMTAFWALISLVHWFDVRGPSPSVVGPLVNTVPFLLFLAIGLLRGIVERRSR